MPVLILATWTVIFLGVAGSSRPLREAALAAFTAVVVLALVLTEALSLFHAITILWLSISWLALSLLAVAICRRRAGAGLSRLRAFSTQWDNWDVLAGVVLGLFALGTLAAALLYPTTNYDSLTLHMPRTFFWAQNHSVAFYPTPDAAQLFSSALPEYLVLNLRVLLFGSDRLSNLAQWLSYVFSVIAVSLLALRLHAGRRGQQVAALAAASVPMAVLQASTTQDELTCALWCVTAVYCVVGFISEAERAEHSRRVWLWWVIWGSSAAALAVQSKASAYLVLPAFFVWLVVVVMKKQGLRQATVLLVLVATCFLAINSAWYLRNASILGGDPVGLRSPSRATFLTKARDPGRLTAIALKNISWFMATPSNELNQVIGNSVSTVVHAYGGDIEDPLTTWPSSKPRPYAIPATMSLRDHDVAPAPLTILLIAFSAVVLLLYPGPDTRYVRTFMACGGVAFVLVAGLITPNVYNNRVLLAPVLALVPVVGVAFTALSRRPGSLAKGVFLTMLVAVTCVGLAAMSWNARNPLVPVPHRIGWSSPGYWSKPYDELRFSVAPEYLAVRTAIVRAVDANGIERIGIVQPGTRGFPVYPLLGALSGREVRYVRYTALADRISPPQFAPQAMLEIVNSEAYPWVLDDGTARGEMLVRPVRLLNWVVFLYRTP